MGLAIAYITFNFWIGALVMSTTGHYRTYVRGIETDSLIYSVGQAAFVPYVVFFPYRQLLHIAIPIAALALLVTMVLLRGRLEQIGKNVLLWYGGVLLPLFLLTREYETGRPDEEWRYEMVAYPFLTVGIIQVVYLTFAFAIIASRTWHTGTVSVLGCVKLVLVSLLSLSLGLLVYDSVGHGINLAAFVIHGGCLFYLGRTRL